MEDSLSYIEAHCCGTLITIMTKKHPQPWIIRVNFHKNRNRPATRENSNFLIFCPNDFYGVLFTNVLSKLFEVLHFCSNGGRFENRHFSIPVNIEKKKCKMMHFEIMLLKINASSSSDELWRNFGTSLRPIKTMNDFRNDFVIHCLSSVENTPSMTPERTNKFKQPLIYYMSYDV